MRDQRSIITQQVLMILVKSNVEQDVIDKVKTKLEVELAKCEVYERCTDLVPIDTTPMQYLEQYLDVKRIEGKSQKTVDRYRYEIGKLLTDLNKPLDEITTSDLRAYLDFRKNNGTRKPLSNRTVDNMRQVYSPFFAWLTAERIIPYNPSLAVHKIKYLETVRTAYSKADLQKLREACDNIRDLSLIDWLAATGCRVDEVANTRVSMINWRDLSCIVVGKGNKERLVYFDEVTALHLNQYLTKRKDMVDALFVNRSGQPITKSGLQQIVNRIGQRAGVAKTHCHRFRHTLATNLSTRMPVVEVAEILGHDDIRTTQVYCHNDQSSVMSDYRRAIG